MNNNTENKPLVSVCCAAYNHEPYIRDALDGFIMQKTDFPFEVIVNDDASTDRTAEIIKEYEIKYPDIIKPNYQTENQYSKGIKPSTITTKLAKGEYIALCEGDDYWTDPLKLQKQVDEMGKHPECDMSFHPALKIYDDGSKKSEYITYLKTGNMIIPPEEIIQNGGGFCPTASLLFTKDVMFNLPELFNDAPVGDFYLQVIGSLRGGALYIDHPLCVYRKGVASSWSSKMENIDCIVEHCDKTVDTLEKFNRYLEFKYNKQFKYRKSSVLWNTAYKLLLNKKYDEFKKYILISWRIYSNQSIEQKILYYSKSCPRLIFIPVMLMYYKSKYIR